MFIVCSLYGCLNKIPYSLFLIPVVKEQGIISIEYDYVETIPWLVNFSIVFSTS